jgi:hypothetical protein
LLFFHERGKDHHAAMKIIYIVFALVFAAATVRADLVIQQQITIATNSSVATMKIKGGKIRLDMYAGQPRAISTITDLKTGDAITLLHTQKMFVKTAGATARQTKPAGNGPTVTAKPPVPRATGKTEKVGGYDTEIYTWSNSRGITGTAWVAKNFPDYARIRTDMAVLDKSAAEANNSLDPELSKLPGMVVKSQVTGNKQAITVTLVSAREEPVDASLFQAPANYKEMPRAKTIKPVAKPVAPKTPGKTAPGK